ncbi:MAG: FAD-dependent oxidoreductase [Lysobacterales bacterium CG17_big_fil_post_rev_8_21_14_2_50_64_11]|nr:MAG: FAD-dependent oxidoreductase [Xanthomonadales bacterium CG17_big_fil_post_rev_8_21_14_2_50_64_11]PIX60514.1 MAG: FAD-dependent oxidoreductase [Xanthomonadales bacterium CG_4_10_14_3_um_filter_64_11]
MPTPNAVQARPHVVIVGAGFAGLSATIALRKARVDITLIDRRNFHLFQPLLYQVATAGLTPADIAWPVRSILRAQRNARVVLGTVTGVNTDAREVRLHDASCHRYDWLVLATGASHNYFGNDAWAAVAPGLKRVDDATDIRRRILVAFEHAELCDDPFERARLMTFVIVGGGPTGVELSGAIAELAKVALARDFRRIDPRQARIILLEGGPRVLATFPEALSIHAQRALEKLGVEVNTVARVTRCDNEGVIVNDQRLPAGTVIWAAGVAASLAAQWVGAAGDRAGRAQVEADLSVPGKPEIFIVGDTAAVTNVDGSPVPGIAPAAKQAGRYVAQVIAAAVQGTPRPAPFRYRHYGNLATIGRHEAVIDFGRFTLSGGLAWWVWGIAHVYFLIGMRHRFLVAAQWMFSYLTFGRGARLIAGSEGDVRIRPKDVAPMR